jgi:predicted aspartyl protease
MSIPVTYDGANRFVSNRPYADIYCHGVAGRIAKPFHLSALIDTGADYLELPNAVAAQIALNLTAYPSHQVLTAGGYFPVTVVNGFTVDIEGKLVKVTAHFMGISTALLGLRAILAAVDIGLETTQWLYKK